MKQTERSNKIYSAEFKINVIIDMQSNYLSYRETVRKYWHTTSRSEEDKYLKTLKSWERIYLEEGTEGLMKESRGQKSKGRPPELDKKLEEDLIAENQRLKMEIEYLKKLSALVQEREEREKRKKQ